MVTDSGFVRAETSHKFTPLQQSTSKVQQPKKKVDELAPPVLTKTAAGSGVKDLIKKFSSSQQITTNQQETTKQDKVERKVDLKKKVVSDCD